MDGARPVRSPRGTTLTARQWSTEAPLRMLMNNLDPEVAERPDDLVVYGGTGRAARDWTSFDAMVRTLTTLKADETMLVQSGRPVGVMQTHEWAPRVLIANSNLVGDWATWPEFRRLEHLGLTMYGQMTAGSWIYIGTQGIVQGTYETFAAVAEKRVGGTLAGTLTLTGGCGGMGGAQPLAVTMNEGVCLIVDVDPARLHRRVEHRYLDEVADSLDHAVEIALQAKAERRAWSVGVVGNAAEVFPELLRRGVPIDVVTDQTSAHDPLSYLPEGISLEDWAEYAEKKPEEFTDRARASMAKHVQAMVDFMDAGAEVFDYGNSIRDEARQGGCERAFDFPGFVPAYIRPLFCEGKGPFRWVALSGDPKDIAATDRAVLDLFPDNDKLHKWIRGAQERIAFQGLPARICWLGQGERDKAGPGVQRPRALRSGAGADRHRPRPPRHRVGGQPLPRDRVDARRLRRHRRLAAAQRAGQHGIRRVVGLDPPRRRRRHRPLAARRPGLAGRRHRPRGAEARAGAHQRPGDGRHPARRRGLRHRRAHRARSRASGSPCARPDPHPRPRATYVRSRPGAEPQVHEVEPVRRRGRLDLADEAVRVARVHLVAGVEGDGAAVRQGRDELGDVLGRRRSCAGPPATTRVRRRHGRHDRSGQDGSGSSISGRTCSTTRQSNSSSPSGRWRVGGPAAGAASRRPRARAGAPGREAPRPPAARRSPPSECPTRSTARVAAANSSSSPTSCGHQGDRVHPRPLARRRDRAGRRRAPSRGRRAGMP